MFVHVVHSQKSTSTALKKYSDNFWKLHRVQMFFNFKFKYLLVGSSDGKHFIIGSKFVDLPIVEVEEIFI